MALLGFGSEAGRCGARLEEASRGQGGVRLHRGVARRLLEAFDATGNNHSMQLR